MSHMRRDGLTPQSKTREDKEDKVVPLAPRPQDFISPAMGVLKWHLFMELILQISSCEISIEDFVMYFPASIAAINDVLENPDDPELGLHTALAIIHNVLGHRTLPYIDPVLGYHCKVPPTRDVMLHAAQLAFVDDAVDGNFPTESLNHLYTALSWIMKAGTAYSIYLSLTFESDPEACQNFIKPFTASSVPPGTMFSILAMWKFPFNQPGRHTKRELMAYTLMMYAVSIGIPALIFYQFFATGNRFEKDAAGKRFESYFIAGAAYEGLWLMKNFFQDRILNLLRVQRGPQPKDFERKCEAARNVPSTTAATNAKLAGAKTKAPSVAQETKAHSVAQDAKDATRKDQRREQTSATKRSAPRISLCRRVTLFALNTATTIAAGYALYLYNSNNNKP